MTRDLSFLPYPGCGNASPRWSGSGVSPSGSWDAWECPYCGHEWREHFPADNPAVHGSVRLPCPVGQECESCGQSVPGLSAREADTPVGVVCLTLCPACVDAQRLPRWTCVGAAHRVLAHCAHTGRDLDGSALDGGGHPDTGAGPCLSCGRIFDEREDRPYCPACEDGPHEPAGGEWPWP